MNARVVAVALTFLALATAPAALATCSPVSTGRDVPTTLILSGGGAKGAYEAGAVAAFAEGGLPIRVVAGSSAEAPDDGGSPTSRTCPSTVTSSARTTTMSPGP